MSEQKPQPIQFGTKLASHKSGPLTSELAENLYLEKAPEGAKFGYSLIGTPGLKAFSQPQATGPVRGLLEFKGLCMAVVGETLYAVSQDKSYTTVGTVEGTGQVSMDYNGTYIWIATAQGKLYAADTVSVLDLSSEIDANLGIVTAQDGYNIVSEQNTQYWNLSGLDADGNTVTGLQTTADTLPGNMMSIISDHREVLAFKEDSIEAYQNVGATGFPFQRTQIVEKGCGAAHSVAKQRNAVFWLGDDLLVYTMSGYQPQPISTDEIASIIAARNSPQTAVAWTYQQEGHTFYVLGFSDYTLVYDLDTQLWHRRRSKGLDRWRVSSHVYMRKWNKHIVGDYSTGDLYELDMNTYSENGTDIIRTAVGAPLFNAGNRFIVDEFFLDIEAGVGIQRGRETAWATATSYSVGDLVSNNNEVYKCTTAGTSSLGGNGPLGTGLEIAEDDLDSILTVLNSVKNEFVDHTNNIGGEFHNWPFGLSIGDATDLSTAVVVANLVSGYYEGHRTDVVLPSHPTDDDTNVITAADAGHTLASLRLLVNDLRTNYEAHRASAVFHLAADAVNVTDTTVITQAATRWAWQHNEDSGEDPEAILDWSSDGGKTWNGNLRRSFGKIGEFKRRAKWHRLGSHRNWHPRIRISEPVPVRINGAYVRMDPLDL